MTIRCGRNFPSAYLLQTVCAVVFALCLLAMCSAISTRTVAAVTVDTVPVGNPGNGNDIHGAGYGGVPYSYFIGTYEVTNAQYAEFLNAKAVTDTYNLYNENMAFSWGGITRAGANGSFSYATIGGRENKPVNFVSWYDAVRFANWLHNGALNGDTESGAYTLLGGTPTPSNGLSVSRNPNASWALTSENEWYKAAYHKDDGATANYFDYPTRSDLVPTADLPPGGSNSASFDNVGILSQPFPVGSYPSTFSAYETFDQAGGLFEWNESLISGTLRGMRGGSFPNGSSFIAASSRLSSDPNAEFLDLGLRVVLLPEPSTLLITTLGLPILAFWNRAAGRR